MMTKFFSKFIQSIAVISLIIGLLSGCSGPASEPIAILMSDIVTGFAPLDVGFNLSFSTHPQGRDITFELDFGDGSPPIRGVELDIILHHTYVAEENYEASLLLVDDAGNSATDSLIITVDSHGPAIGLEIGSTAPDFEGSLTTGGTMWLSDYRGSIVILDFWGSWCSPCRNSMPDLDNLVTKYKSQGLVAVVVSTDVSEFDTVNFLMTNNLTQFVSVWEPGGKLNPIDLLYGDVSPYPTTYVIDRQGVIRYISVGYPSTITDALLESLL
jgi:peroxiredoxin